MIPALVPDDHASHFVNVSAKLLLIPAEFLLPLITLHGESLKFRYAVSHLSDDNLWTAVHHTLKTTLTTMNDY